MAQSTTTVADLVDVPREARPRHIAIIMDGNGRWAQRQGLPRIEGHRHGVASVRRATEECARLDIEQLTLYCLSSENWKRPQRELDRIEWPDTGEVGFHAPAGKLIDILRSSGFEIERLVELYASADAETHEFYKDVTPEWGQKWPVEEIWVARKSS